MSSPYFLTLIASGNALGEFTFEPASEQILIFLGSTGDPIPTSDIESHSVDPSKGY
jgi:hypothetical protein